MKMFIKILLSILIIFILVSGSGMFYLTRGLESGSKLKVDDVNLTSLSDGTYTGKYEAGRWANEVSVVVKDHKIVKVDVVKDVTFAKPDVTEKILSSVVENQNTNIDTISGSTVTCKAYLKSIENALKK
jgi:uncharacterized protein with FMN-binding domain